MVDLAAGRAAGWVVACKERSSCGTDQAPDDVGDIYLVCNACMLCSTAASSVAWTPCFFRHHMPN